MPCGGHFGPFTCTERACIHVPRVRLSLVLPEKHPTSVLELVGVTDYPTGFRPTGTANALTRLSFEVGKEFRAGFFFRIRFLQRGLFFLVFSSLLKLVPRRHTAKMGPCPLEGPLTTNRTPPLFIVCGLLRPTRDPMYPPPPTLSSCQPSGLRFRVCEDQTS